METIHEGRPAYGRSVSSDTPTRVAGGQSRVRSIKKRTVRAPYGPWMFGLGPELVSPDRISWWWKRARQVSGIDAKWRLHDVRAVAGRLGHANPAMTSRVYGDAFAAADRAVAAGLGDILKGEDG